MKLIIQPQAQRDFRKLNKESRERIYEVLQKFSAETKLDIKKLQGKDNVFRIRVGDYRIIVQISKNPLVGYVLRVLHRKEVYDKF